MFFDSDSFQQLIKTNKNNLHFLQDHKLLDPHKSFIDHLSSSSYQIGFELPCHVDSFQVQTSQLFADWLKFEKFFVFKSFYYHQVKDFNESHLDLDKISGYYFKSLVVSKVS